MFACRDDDEVGEFGRIISSPKRIRQEEEQEKPWKKFIQECLHE